MDLLLVTDISTNRAEIHYAESRSLLQSQQVLFKTARAPNIMDLLGVIPGLDYTFVLLRKSSANCDYHIKCI